MKKLTFLLFALAFTSVMHAKQVTEEQALKIAQKFFKNKLLESRNLSRSKNAGQKTNVLQDFYVFNAENKGGFVIISGDDRTPEVLGYSNNGCLDIDSMPSHVKAWLEGYVKQIVQIRKDGNEIIHSVSSVHPAIHPLLTTMWGQDYPYNSTCPVFFDSEDNCVTGCVATAMAQVMFYHRAKSTNKIITKIPGYNGSTYWQDYGQITIDAIPKGTIIDWANILERYNGSETDEQREAVANLMFYCGASVKMDYGPNGLVLGRGAGSGSYPSDVPTALKRYFDYSEHTTLVWRKDYTEEKWDELIYSELSKGNPVYYCGYNSSAGHAFVCDGYDGDGYYHINWGWDGLSDSYFLLSALNPSEQGTGGSAEGYNLEQCALIGAVPNGEVKRLTSQKVSLPGNTSFSIAETGDNIALPVRWVVQNQTGSANCFDHAVGLYFNGNLVNVLKETGTSVTVANDDEIKVDISLKIGTSLKTGVYQLYALSKIHGEDKWFMNENSSECFITLVVNNGLMVFYVGKPAIVENVIDFTDEETKRICVENWDADGDGEISYEEAASVKDFGTVFEYSIIRTFDEAQFFTGISTFNINSTFSLVSIKLPPSVISISDGAFYECKALSTLEIPGSVKEIGKNAFQGCFSLQTIILHEGLEKIDDNAFLNCFALSSICIPASVTSLGNDLWHGCTNLNNLYVEAENPNYCAIDGVIFSEDRKTLMYFPIGRTGTYSIPNGTESVNTYAFFTSNLENITFPTSVTNVGDYALGGMINIKEFTIPSSLTNIGNGMLSTCVNLKKVIFEGNMSKIPNDMFMRCWSLKNIELPEEIASIGSYAFFECEELRRITIPSKVTSIGDHAFSNSGLKKITSLMQVPCSINSTVFENVSCNNPSATSSVYEQNNAVLYVPKESLNAYKEADNWKDFYQILPIGEHGIESYAEYNNGVLYFYNDTSRDKRKGDTYDLPSGIFIEWYDQNPNITKLVFDSSFAEVKPVSTIGWFRGCSNLTEIQGIENLNTCEVVEMSSMFSGCSKLTSIDLSKLKTNNVTSVDAMFWGCSSLETVILPSDLKIIGSRQFIYCSSLTKIEIPSFVTSILDHAFDGCYSLTEITIPSEVTYIGDRAFANVGMSSTALKADEYELVVKCYAESVPNAAADAFKNSLNHNCLLLVNDNIVDAYKTTSPWSQFRKIQGFQEAAGIGSIRLEKSNAHIYDMKGNRIDNFQKGVNIIRMKDGKTKKFVVR